jgi:hypothetical protein
MQFSSKSQLTKPRKYDVCHVSSSGTIEIVFNVRRGLPPLPITKGHYKLEGGMSATLLGIFNARGHRISHLI